MDICPMTANNKQKMDIPNLRHTMTNKKIVLFECTKAELKRKVGDKLKEVKIVDNDFTGELTVIFNQGGVRDIKRLSII